MIRSVSTKEIEPSHNKHTLLVTRVCELAESLSLSRGRRRYDYNRRSRQTFPFVSFHAVRVERSRIRERGERKRAKQAPCADAKKSLLVVSALLCICPQYCHLVPPVELYLYSCCLIYTCSLYYSIHLSGQGRPAERVQCAARLGARDSLW